jgi:hypothetical protein
MPVMERRRLAPPLTRPSLQYFSCRKISHTQTTLNPDAAISQCKISRRMQATADAAGTLAAAIHHYAAPDNTISYGVEIDALRRACAAVKESPFDPEAGAELLRLEQWYLGLLHNGVLPGALSAKKPNTAFTQSLLDDARAKYPRLRLIYQMLAFETF